MHHNPVHSTRHLSNQLRDALRQGLHIEWIPSVATYTSNTTITNTQHWVCQANAWETLFSLRKPHKAAVQALHLVIFFLLDKRCQSR